MHRILESLDLPMTDLLRSIPGPVFLLLFWVWTGLATYFQFYFVWKSAPASFNDRPLDPYQLAVLARGHRGLVETALAAASSRNLLEIDREAETVLPLDSGERLDQVLEELFRELHKSEGSISNLELPYSYVRIRKELLELGYIDSTSPMAGVLRGFALFAPIAILGLLKLDIGLSRGKPIGLLLFSLVAYLPFALIGIFKQPSPGRPARGLARLVSRRRTALQSILLDAPTARAKPERQQTLAALFGFRELQATPWGSGLPIIGLAIATSPVWLQIPTYTTGGSSGSDSGCGGGSSDTGSGGDSGCGGGGGSDSGCGGGGGCGGCGGGSSD